MPSDSPSPPNNADIQLAEVRRAISRLLDQTSHDFRTPLTVIKEFATLMRDGLVGAVTPSQHEYLDVINERADDLTAMVDNVLDAGKLDAGLMRLWRQPTDVAQVVGLASALPRRKAAAKKIPFEMTIEPNLPAVHADAEQLTRILHNLVAEALDAYYEPESLQLRAYLDSGRNDVCFELAIRGGHVEPDRLAAIRDAVEQSRPRHESAAGGSLDRLRLIRRLVELHLGLMRFEHSANGETFFRVTIPTDEPLRLLAGYLHRSPTAAVESLEADLIAVTINPRVKAVVANVVDEFLQQWTGENDLAVHVEKHRWLLLLNGDEARAANLLERIEAAWTDTLESRPGGLLPRVAWTTLGHWSLDGSEAGLIDRFRAELTPTISDEHRPTVLLVDDDATFLRRARGVLETAGYRVLAATDGESALTVARSNVPDVVLVDSRLPNLDGLALLARLRDDPLTADILVLFASTCSTDQSRALEGGARIVLGKPVAPTMLVDVLARVVDPPCVESARPGGDPFPEERAAMAGSL